MPLPVIVVLALVGFVLGPRIYGWAILAGRRERPRRKPMCEWCHTGDRRMFGPCTSCGRGVRAREPVWWLVSAAGFASAAVVAGPSWTLPAYVVFAVITTVLTITDLDHKLIPNAVLYPGGSIALALLVLGSLLDGEADRLPGAIGAGLGYFGVLFGVAVVARGGFGFGDVKLAALLGPFVGYQSFELFLVSVFFTGAAGGVAAIALIVFRRAGFGDELPYGPAMVLGAWGALLGGALFLQWIR